MIWLYIVAILSEHVLLDYSPNLIILRGSPSLATAFINLIDSDMA